MSDKLSEVIRSHFRSFGVAMTQQNQLYYKNATLSKKCTVFFLSFSTTEVGDSETSLFFTVSFSLF